MQGTVIAMKLDKRFGFIHSHGADYFFHANDLADGLDFDATLQERRVEFDCFTTDKGEHATNVRAAE